MDGQDEGNTRAAGPMGGQAFSGEEPLARVRERAIERLVDTVQKSERLLADRSARVTLENVDRLFAYQPWDKAQQECGDVVREILAIAAKQILRSVPPGALRTRAINKLADARMLANAAISFRGEF